MASSVLFLLLFVSGGLPLIQGIKLPGPCPNVTPTFVKGNFNFARILYSIPLSGIFTPSHFFRDIQELINLIPDVILGDGDFKGLHYRDRLDDQSIFPQAFFVWDTVERKNHSLTLKGRIVDASLKRRLCNNDLIEENFHVWTENKVVLMWTCKEGDNGQGMEHDEALIVYLNDLLSKEKVKAMEPEMRNLVKKYVGDHFEQLIDFEQPVKVAQDQKYPRFYCSKTTVKAENLGILVAWIVISLGGLLLMAIRTRLYLTQD